MLSEKEILKLIDMRIVELGLLKVDCLLPWTGIINKECCSGIVRNKGLYTQCSVKKNGDELCKSCSKKAKNSNSPVMHVGRRSDSNWRSDKGIKPISYSRYLKENNITRKEAELKARSLGVELDDSYFVEEKRGRKKKSAIVSDSDSDVENVEKRKRGRPHKKKADALNDLLKEASMKKSKVKKAEVKKAKVTKDAEVSLENDSLKIFYGVVDNRKEKQSVLWRTKLNEHYTIKQFKIQPKSWPNSKGGLYKCNADEIDTKTLVEIKDHIEKNYKIINKAKTNEIVNQFKNKTLKDETVITAKDETVITAEDDNLITAEDDIVIEQPITTAEDETLITAEDETLITAEDETVITAEDETLITAEDDTLEIDQISLGGLSDEDEGEDDSLDIEQQSVTSLSDHENEEDVEDDQVNKDLDENDNEELDLGNVSDFLEETDVEEEEEEEEEEESSMKPFYIKQSGFTFMGEIVEERTSVIKYTICTKTNAVYDENDREIGTWNPTDKSFTPK
tara:strand:+ start:375 stop:1901 length:1527 start_codon:yes stop_codon:yes gene_type:complete